MCDAGATSRARVVPAAELCSRRALLPVAAGPGAVRVPQGSTAHVSHSWDSPAAALTASVLSGEPQAERGCFGDLGVQR